MNGKEKARAAARTAKKKHERQKKERTAKKRPTAKKGFERQKKKEAYNQANCLNRKMGEGTCC